MSDLSRFPTAATLLREIQSQRFNGTTGAFGYWTEFGPTGANNHPDRCVCQGRDPTPHKHYSDPPYSCARCLSCNGYEPAIGALVSR